MSRTLIVAVCLLWAGMCLAQQQPPPGVQSPSGGQPVIADLNLILTQLQRAAVSTNGDLGKLRIEKWKTDNDQKEQLQKMVDSLQRNLTNAVPGLINEVQNSRGSMSSTFKLYHNITIVFEYLSSVTDAAGVLGKKEEYEPLAADAAALDSARQNLSTYIEQAAVQIESRKRNPPRPAGGSAPAAGVGTKGPNKVVVDKNGVSHIIIEDDDGDKPAKSTKKKASQPAQAKPSPKASPQPVSTPK
jgi:hypothetical protein